MKINFTPKSNYAEIGQPNPLRWVILSGSPEEGFVNESAWLKCKDFFNDYVVAYNGGTRFNIYGFSTNDMKIPKQGEPVYFAVNFLTKHFSENLGKFNNWLVERQLPPILFNPSESYYILEIPPFYLKSTYNISLLSLIIRLCNSECAFNSFDELIAHTKFPQQDQNLWNTVVKKGVFFKLPEKLQKFVWYCGEKQNSENIKDGYSLPSLVHNCGLMEYSRHF